MHVKICPLFFFYYIRNFSSGNTIIFSTDYALDNVCFVVEMNYGLLYQD